MDGLRRTQRAPKACYECYTRKVKCDRRIPCSRCIVKGMGDSCGREKVLVNGVLYNGESASRTEELEKENRYLKKRLEELLAAAENLVGPPPTIDRTNSFIVKNPLDLYGTGVRILTREFEVGHINEVNMKMEYLSVLPNFISKEVSEKLLKFNFEHLIFLHTALHPQSFMFQHEHFWAENEYPHLSSELGRDHEEYLWMSIWYACLSGSLFMISEDLQDELGLSADKTYYLAKVTCSASLECLHRGQFLSIPNVKSVQAFCVLTTCFHAFSGVHLENSLLCSVTYMAEALKINILNDYNSLSTLDFEISCRLWWLLVIIDWLESFQRRHIIFPSSFTTNLPRNIAEESLLLPKPIESDQYEVISYNRSLVALAKIKNKYYHDNMVEMGGVSLKDLIYAEAELTLVFSNTMDMIQRSKLSNRLMFQKYLVEVKFNRELLEVNRMKSNHEPKTKWIRNSRDACISHAFNILNRFCDDQIPFHFKKFWFVNESVVSACVFLLLDITLNIPLENPDPRFDLVLKQLPMLETLEQTHSGTKTGIKLINKLSKIILERKRKATFVKDEAYFGDLLREIFENKGQIPEVHGSQNAFLESGVMRNNLQDILQVKEWNNFLHWITTNDSNSLSPKLPIKDIEWHAKKSS